MRRGKLNNLAYLLVIISAIFTIISYGADQMVIRSEDKVRTLNVKYNSLQAEISSKENLLSTIENISIQNSALLVNLKQRNFWLKNILFQKIALKSIKESLLERKVDLRNFKNNVLNNAWDYFYNVSDQSYHIRIQYGVAKYANPKIFDEIQYYQKNKKKIERLIYMTEENIFKENKLQFYQKSYKDYKKIYTLPELDVLDLRMWDWIDLSRMTILNLEKVHIMNKEFYEISEELEKIIEERNLDLDTLLRKIKNSNAIKNYYILGSIISQILTLLFLLILFKKMIIFNQKI